MKPYLIPLIIVLMILLFSACGNQDTSPTATATPSATMTISIEQITAAATYRRTLPPSFTPTFTPTATATPSITPTASITPTPSTVPESALCEAFVISIIPPVTPVGILMLITLKSKLVVIHVRVTYIETGEIVVEGDLPSGTGFQVQFNARDMPYNGDYRWEMSLTDATRSAMCLHGGKFTIQKRVATPEATAEAVIAPTTEVTPELTVEVTTEGN